MRRHTPDTAEATIAFDTVTAQAGNADSSRKVVVSVVGIKNSGKSSLLNTVDTVVNDWEGIAVSERFGVTARDHLGGAPVAGAGVAVDHGTVDPGMTVSKYSLIEGQLGYVVRDHVGLMFHVAAGTFAPPDNWEDLLRQTQVDCTAHATCVVFVWDAVFVRDAIGTDAWVTPLETLKHRFRVFDRAPLHVITKTDALGGPADVAGVETRLREALQISGAVFSLENYDSEHRLAFNQDTHNTVWRILNAAIEHSRAAMQFRRTRLLRLGGAAAPAGSFMHAVNAAMADTDPGLGWNRDMRVFIFNGTPHQLSRGDCRASSGKFQPPPPLHIEALGFARFANVKSAILRGAQGYATFWVTLCGSTYYLKFSWQCPFLGTNEYPAPEVHRVRGANVARKLAAEPALRAEVVIHSSTKSCHPVVAFKVVIGPDTMLD